MKIAVCLSGLVRTYRDTYQNFLSSLIEPNQEHQIDCFISTWPVEHSNNSMERTRRLSWYGDATPAFPESPIDYADLQNKYNPIFLEVERPRQFVEPTWYRETPGLNIQAVLSMTYKIWATDLLRRRHEELAGFKYDAVVRHRFDALLPFPIVIKPEELVGAVVVPSMMQPRWDERFDWTNDKFAIGDSETMSVYSDWYRHLGGLVEGGLPIQPEILLRAHLVSRNIAIKPFESEVELVRIAGF